MTAAWAVVCDVAATVNAIAADSSHGNRNAPCRNLAYAAPWWLDVINRAPPVTDAVLARLNTDVSGLCDTPAHRRHLFGGTHETRLRQLRKVSEACVRLTACKWCSDQYEVSGKLVELGIDVKYMGKPLTEYLKSDASVIVF